MKKRLMLLAAYLLAVLLGTACGPQPQLEVGEYLLQLGDVVNGEVIVREVTLTNSGSANLEIGPIGTSCGCTEARIEPMVIPPGDSAVLTISFDSGAHGPDLTGPLVRQVFVNSNDPQQPDFIVELSVNIQPPPAGDG